MVNSYVNSFLEKGIVYLEPVPLELQVKLLKDALELKERELANTL